MLKVRFLAAAAALCSVSAAHAAADGLTIDSVSAPAPEGVIYLQTSGGDVDGDGAADLAIIRLRCAGGAAQGIDFHYNVKSPRDAASGQASGKRTHHPVTFVKEWGAATPQLRALVQGWDLKKNDKARLAASDDGWTPLDVGSTAGLCPAAEDAARKATKSRSNIQNN